MATTTNFQEWIDSITNDDIEEIYCLYECIEGVTEMGAFKCTQKNDMLFVQNRDNGLTLMLSSEKAIKMFLDLLDKTYGDDFGDVYGNYNFYRSMEDN